MQERDEREKYLMLIAQQLRKAREDKHLLGPIALMQENEGSEVFITRSSYHDFKLRVGRPCYIEEGVSRFPATYLGRNRLGQLRFSAQHLLYGKYDLDEVSITPLSETFLTLAAKHIKEDKVEGSLLPAFLKLIEGGRERKWCEHAAGISKSDGISIIWGPPGTGKTTYIARKARERFSAGDKVLVLSTNNTALNSFENACEDVPVVYLEHSDSIASAVILSTFAKLLLLIEYSDFTAIFDTVIVDEVSTARIPDLMIAALAAKKGLILIGDYMQLGIVAEDEVVRTPLEEDIFTYLSIPEDKNPECDILHILKRQNRMRPAISSFISKNFYHGLLEDGHLEFKSYRSKLEKLFPTAMEKVDISPLYTYPAVTSTSSHINLVSAVIAAALAAKWKEDTALSVSVLTPYTAQSSLISTLISELYVRTDIGVSTVHALQGSEADIIIFDSVDSFPFPKAGKLFDEPYDEFPSPLDRFINVAVSRAREKFILITDSAFFSIHARGTVFEALLEACSDNKERLGKVLKEINSTSLLFGIPGRERNSSYEKAWSMRKRFFEELCRKSRKSEYSFFISDRERISSYPRALIKKVSECGRNITFIYRSGGEYHYRNSFHLTGEWLNKHPAIKTEHLTSHPYLYALSFVEEKKSSKSVFIWYGVFNPSNPYRGRSVPILRIKASQNLAKYLKYIR